MIITATNWNLIQKNEYHLIMPREIYEKLNSLLNKRLSFCYSSSYCRLSIRKGRVCDFGDCDRDYYEEDYPSHYSNNIWVTGVVRSKLLHTKI